MELILSLDLPLAAQNTPATLPPSSTPRGRGKGAGARALLWGLWACLAPLARAEAQQAADSPIEEAKYLYKPIPGVSMRCAREGQLSFDQVLEKGPALLALAYTRCTGVCSPFLRSLKTAVDDADQLRGNARVVVLSFDPRDSTDDLWRAAARLGVADDPSWLFCTGGSSEIERLASSIGFDYRWDEEKGQYDHPALLAAVAGGEIRRLLVGAVVSRPRLRETLRELAGGFVPVYPLPGKALFRCFRYNAEDGSVEADWGYLLLVFPGAAAMLVALRVFTAARHREV